MKLPARGSSRVLSKQLAALGLRQSAWSTISARAGASYGRVEASATMSLACSIKNWVVSGTSTRTSGCWPARMRRHTSQVPQPCWGSCGQHRASASPRAALRLPTPSGPSNKMAWARRPDATARKSSAVARSWPAMSRRRIDDNGSRKFRPNRQARAVPVDLQPWESSDDSLLW